MKSPSILSFIYILSAPKIFNRGKAAGVMFQNDWTSSGDETQEMVQFNSFLSRFLRFTSNYN